MNAIVTAGPATDAPRSVAGRGALVGPRLDGWLVGGLAVAAWVVLNGVTHVGGADALVFRGVLLWVLLAVIASHFGVSYHLAYGQGRDALRRHPLALVVVPLAIVTFAVVVIAATAVGLDGTARSGARLGLVTVYSLTTWHYVKQTYGVVRVGAALSGLTIGSGAAKVLRFGLYPLWFFEAATVWSHGYRAADYGFDASFALLPSWAVDAFHAGSALSASVIAGTLAHLALTQRCSLPATVWTPYAAAFLWIAWQPDHLSAILVLGAAHALQYLACAHRAEVVWGRERGEPGLSWWCSVFGGALATGMLLTYWLPMWLGYAGGSQLGVTMAAMLFVVFNLHHYAIDAAIWRSRDGHVRRLTRTG